MVTGYTAVLDETDKSTRDWIMEDLIRQFGICVVLREEPFGLTEEAILKKIKEESDYQERSLKEAKEDFTKYEAMTDGQWKKLMEKKNKEIVEDNERSRKEAMALKEIHLRAARDLNLVKDNTENEITKTICEFGLQQLDVTKRECEPCITELHTDMIAFKKNKLDDTINSVQYHTVELKEQNERNEKRVQEFLKVRDDVNSILGKKE